jgi:hypothetical protein
VLWRAASWPGTPGLLHLDSKYLTFSFRNVELNRGHAFVVFEDAEVIAVCRAARPLVSVCPLPSPVSCYVALVSCLMLCAPSLLIPVPGYVPHASSGWLGRCWGSRGPWCTGSPLPGSPGSSLGVQQAPC